MPVKSKPVKSNVVKPNIWLTLLLACTILQAQASENADEVPDQELLEFLGKWENVDGQWVDPGQLQDLSMFQQKDTGEHHEK